MCGVSGIHWKGSLAIKGVMHEDDAEIAMRYGADGFIFSNHAGRQLDGTI
nr:alpha-hydroxy-acid oxidizing protein [Rhizobium sp. CG5]